MITDLNCEWIKRLVMLYPKIPAVLEENGWPFAFILVNPPREATPEEIEHFREKGFEYDMER